MHSDLYFYLWWDVPNKHRLHDCIVKSACARLRQCHWWRQRYSRWLIHTWFRPNSSHNHKMAPRDKQHWHQNTTPPWPTNNKQQTTDTPTTPRPDTLHATIDTIHASTTHTERMVCLYLFALDVLPFARAWTLCILSALIWSFFLSLAPYHTQSQYSLHNSLSSFSFSSSKNHSVRYVHFQSRPNVLAIGLGLS